MTRTLAVITILLLPSAALLLLQEWISLDLPREPGVLRLEFPGGSDAQLPNLSVWGREKVLLSWVEPVDERTHRLQWSSLRKSGWDKARTVAQGENWFVNWADFPSVNWTAEDSFLAHWLVRTSGRVSYDIHMSQSTSLGSRWSEPVTPHDDKTASEHGFVSVLPWGDEALIVWLDGRHMAKDDMGNMTLRAAFLGRDGSVRAERVIDERVCTCCQTDAATNGSEVLIVYRDRSEGEIRDISLLRYSSEGWQEPQDISEDGWEIAGCPVNGPAIDIRDSVAIVAWFTLDSGTPTVYARVSADGGATFKPKVQLDEGNPMGRVDSLVLPDGSALVTWLESTGGDEAHLRVRRLTTGGLVSKPFTVGISEDTRRTGFPRLVGSGGSAVVAWTGAGPDYEIQTAILLNPQSLQ